MIHLPCAGRITSYTVTDNMLSTLSQDWHHIDVPDQLDRFRVHLETNPHRQGAHDLMPKRITAWLDRSVPTKTASDTLLTREAKELLTWAIGRGMVPAGFKPNGQTESEQILSIQAKITITSQFAEQA